MKRLDFSFSIDVYPTFEELPADFQILMNAAKEATQLSYSPYSKFRVGAAVLLENGKIVKGANQENAAYPSGLCAERVAFFSASVQYPNTPIKAIAITAKNEKHILKKPVSPCGACRQVMAETEHHHGQPIAILLQGEEGAIYHIQSVQAVLPLLFDASFL